MSDINKDFEKRFTCEWFSAGWAEVMPTAVEKAIERKDLTTLQSELEQISEIIETIDQKQLRLMNLAMLYKS